MIESLDRKAIPELKLIDKIDIPDYQQIQLDNGLQVYLINVGKQEIVKIEFSFRAGKWFQPERLISGLCTKMLKEGTQSMDSKTIAESLDYYAATLTTFSTVDFSGLVLYSLVKHLDKVLPIVADLIQYASFPGEEFEIMCKNRKQHLEIEMEKNDFLASRIFFAALFGIDHPVGTFSKPEDYDRVDLQKIRQFHLEHFVPNNCKVFVSGNFDASVEKLIEKYFGVENWKAKELPKEPNHQHVPATNLNLLQDLEDSVQSSIRVGQRFLTKKHPDFHGLSVANTILGGYFGSRLMKNIREEKGYTYGIYSHMQSMLHEGYFSIATDVGKPYREKTLDEISSEINRLSSEPVGMDEMEIVRNYLSSKILGNLDGPFNLLNTMKGLILFDLDKSYLYDRFHTIRTIEPNTITELVKKYFIVADMHKVTVG